MARFKAIICICALLLAGASASAADLRVIVMGVDAYQHERNLHGAVNDANSVAAALRPFANSLALLLDAQVTRDAVLRAWSDTLAASRPGDTIMVTFSGHGGRERVRVSREAPLGFRQFWVMADFDRGSQQGIGRRILSSEVAGWAKAAEAARVKLIILADHCYAGTIYRSVGVDTLGIRSIPLLVNPDVPLDEKPPNISELQAAPPPPGVTSLAADRSDRPVAEFRITDTGQVHGALSFAFADALGKERQYVDRSGDGRITRGALLNYLQTKVTQMSDGAQEPQLRPADPEDDVLFSLPRTPAPAPREEDQPVALSVIGMSEADGRAVVAAVPGAAWEPDPSQARLVWEWRAQAPRLVTGLNQFVSFDLARADLPAAVAKIRAADALGRLAAAGSLKVVREGEHGAAPPAVYIEGDRVRLAVEGMPGPNLVVFNLAEDGRVQFLYPEPTDAPIAWPTRRFELFDVDARAPFGGDHVVAVASNHSLNALADAIRALDQKPEAAAARKAVEQALASDDAARVAVTAVFTAPAEMRCDPEVIRDAAMLAACHK
jgi:hypothetical protein